MPLDPPITEDLLALLDKYPDLTETQRALIKSTAAYLVEDEMALLEEDMPSDPRLVLTEEQYYLLPDRIELWGGVPSPKHWETPNRLAAARRSNERLARKLNKIKHVADPRFLER